jgi:hypothetical protein
VSPSETPPLSFIDEPLSDEVAADGPSGNGRRYLVAIAILIFLLVVAIALSALLVKKDGGPAAPVTGTWREAHRWPARSYLRQDIALAGADSVWVTFVDPQAPRSNDTLRSSDGGRTWRSVIAEVRASTGLDASYGFANVDFVDGRRGYLLGAGQLVTTTDGGATWQKVSGEAPASWYSVSWGDAEHGLCDNMVARGPGFVTQDGGVSWRTMAMAGPATQGSESGLDTIAVDMVDGQTGWVAGNWMSGAGDVGTPCTARSSDGGATWTRLAVPPAESADKGMLVSIDFISTEVGWVGGTMGLFHTVNAGVGWKAQALPQPGWSVVATGFLDADVGWVAAVDDSLVPTKSAVFHTVDGGTTWRQELPAQPAGGVFVPVRIAPVDAAHAWMLGFVQVPEGAPHGGETVLQEFVAQ